MIITPNLIRVVLLFSLAELLEPNVQMPMPMLFLMARALVIGLEFLYLLLVTSMATEKTMLLLALTTMAIPEVPLFSLAVSLAPSAPMPMPM